jgi:predicted acetyltransferase
VRLIGRLLKGVSYMSDAITRLVKMTNNNIVLPNAPEELSGSVVELHFNSIKPGDVEKGYVPFYHYRIIDKHGNDVGHINFKVGTTDHILYNAGHIGYEIKEDCRGHSYAYHACSAIAPFVKTIYPEALITCSPENGASIRTIEKLNCLFIDEVKIHEHEEAYKNGERIRRRYVWFPETGFEHTTANTL